MPVDVGWLYADIRYWKQTSRVPAAQAGLQTSLDRGGGSPFSTCPPQLRHFRLRSLCDGQLVAVDLTFSVRCRERGKLNEDKNFDALARVSLSERTLRAAGTSKLLRRALSFCVDRHHRDVAATLIGPRDGKPALDRNAGARLVLRKRQLRRWPR
jgi:hypothetical protein